MSAATATAFVAMRSAHASAVARRVALGLDAHSAHATVPNVIFFATDDLNDWVGPPNSPLRAKTPNLDRLAPDAGLEGQSPATTLRQPALARDRNILLCDVNPGGHAIVNQRWRYIHYADGTEELYNVVQDPNEWDILAPQEEYQSVMAGLRQSAPKQFAPPGPEWKDLRLVTEGERFCWELKPAGSKKKAKTSR